MSPSPARSFPASLHVCLAALCLVLLSASSSSAALETRQVRIGFIGASNGDAMRGASQGIEEANAQGRFLGWQYELVPLADAAAARAADVAVIVADAGPGALRAIASAVAPTAVINVSAADDTLRAACLPNLLHTLPSAAMRADAEAQWRHKHADSRATARAWHESFRKYAAAQLNRRYETRHGLPMSDVAWAAWAAVKLVSNTIATHGEAAPAKVHDMIRGDIAFDGQKGADMNFRDTGQLRQPLLLVDGDTIVGEAPVRGVADPGDLDTLGLAACAR